MATQKAFASYQEIIDLHTESDRVSAIGIHTPNNDTPHKMFGGFFDQFKKFKYLGCSVALVPVARLPVDPLQVSYEAGEPTIDPRDVVNPILFHGCHGNDIGAILNQLYTIGALGSSDFADAFKTDSIDKMDFANDPDDPFGQLTLLENLYYKALVDNTWRKAHPQKGFKKSGLRPLIYKLATNYQINPEVPFGELDYGVNGRPEIVTEDQEVSFHIPNDPSAPRFFTNKLTGLGWLDTRNVIAPAVQDEPYTLGDDIQAKLSEMLEKTTCLAKLPKIFMGVILLPPAYKTEQYFRMIINHHFAFAGFRGLSFRNDTLGLMPPSVFDLNDTDPVDPPEPDPPAPMTFSATLTVQTFVHQTGWIEQDVSTAWIRLNGETKLVSETDTTVTFTGLENGTYTIAAGADGYTFVESDPSTIVINGADVTDSVNLDFEQIPSVPVITVSNKDNVSYRSFKIDNGEVTTISMTSTNSMDVQSPLTGIRILENDTLLLQIRDSTLYVDPELMARGSISNGIFVPDTSVYIVSITGTGENSTLASLLMSGNYTLVEGS